MSFTFLDWLAMEALHRIVTAGVYAEVYIADLNGSHSWAKWPQVRDSFPRRPPLMLMWPYGDKMKRDTATGLLHDLLIREVPDYWEAQTEDYLLAGIIAQRQQRESAALDLYARTHI